VYGITGSGSASEVMSKVVAASVALIREKKYNLISMTAKEPSRQKLYDRMVKGMASLLPDYMVVATGGQKKAVTGSNQSTNPSTSEAYFNAVDIAGEIQDEAESETRQKLFSTINAGIEERHRASGESMDGMTVIRDMNDFMSFWGIAKSSPAATPEIIEMVSSLPSMNRPPGFDAIEYLSVRAASMTDDQLRSVNLNRDGTRIPGFRIQPARIREYAIVRRELKDDYEEELASKPGKYEVLVMSTMRWKKRSRAVWRMGAWHDKIKTTRMSSWEQYTGPREGEGWKHKSTGEVRYQPDQPDDSEGIVNLGDKVLVEKIKPPKGDWDVDDKGQPDPSTTGQMTALKNSGWQYDFETGAWIEGTPEPKVLKKAPAPVVRSGGQDEDAYVQKMLHELKLTRNDLLKFHRAAGLSAHSLKTDEDLARSLWRNVAIHNQKRTVGSGDKVSVNTMKPLKEPDPPKMFAEVFQYAEDKSEAGEILDSLEPADREELAQYLESKPNAARKVAQRLGRGADWVKEYGVVPRSEEAMAVRKAAQDKFDREREMAEMESKKPELPKDIDERIRLIDSGGKWLFAAAGMQSEDPYELEKKLKSQASHAKKLKDLKLQQIANRELEEQEREQKHAEIQNRDVRGELVRGGSAYSIPSELKEAFDGQPATVTINGQPTQVNSWGNPFSTSQGSRVYAYVTPKTKESVLKDRNVSGGEVQITEEGRFPFGMGDVLTRNNQTYIVTGIGKSNYHSRDLLDDMDDFNAQAGYHTEYKLTPVEWKTGDPETKQQESLRKKTAFAEWKKTAPVIKIHDELPELYRGGDDDRFLNSFPVEVSPGLFEHKGPYPTLPVYFRLVDGKYEEIGQFTTG